ncbi:MAG: SDR family oxidoreductase [Anaerolineales bacterium]|nr:SDR family oxidoreductase [Anaerolineales bacterium]
MRFQNQVAVITGGGNGMGRATALRFAREGARVVVADIESESAARVADEIRAGGGDALGVTVDVSERESVAAMVARAVEQYGRVDILCAIAGIAGGVPFLELDDARWKRMLAVNLTGVFLCGQLAAQQMVKQGAGGKIVNMSSTNGLVGEADFAHYNAAKFGVVGLTMTMAIELAPHNIRVNAVCPGLIRTRLSEDLLANAAFADEYRKKIPLGRFASADEVAGAFLFLASDDASFITGTTLVVDGGQLTF